jgi:hypothetical protein
MKKKIKLFLYPDSVELKNVGLYSPRLIWLLSELDIHPIETRYHGEISAINIEEPVLVRASSMIMPRIYSVDGPFGFKWPREAEWCAEKGYFLFYDDHYIDIFGVCNYELLVPKFIEFVSRFMLMDEESIDLDRMNRNKNVKWARALFNRLRKNRNGKYK